MWNIYDFGRRIVLDGLFPDERHLRKTLSWSNLMDTQELISHARFTNPEVKKFAEYCLNQAPPYFWTKPSSSSGKYHPPDEHSIGGLALHTSRVVDIAEIILKSTTKTLMEDSIRLACLLHDVARYGLNTEPSKHSLDEHPELAKDFLSKRYKSYHMDITEETIPSITLINLTRLSAAVISANLSCLRHMGRWGLLLPETEEDWIVHYADCIATHYWTSEVCKRGTPNG